MSVRKLMTGIVLLASIVLLTACGAAKVAVEGPEEVVGGRKRTADGRMEVTKEAREDFQKALDALAEAEQAGLTKEKCEKVADMFEEVADDHGNMVEALYNIGAIYRKCGMKKEAIDAFEETLDVDPKHQLSLTHLAVYKLEDGDVKGAEKQLTEAINVGKNRLDAVPAYANLAHILREKGNKGRKKAYEEALLNLRRALAIEAKYMPALYELAMLYFDMAIHQKKSSLLTLSKLVCDQAIKLDPEYGLIFHVVGQLNMVEGNLVDALKNFEAAFSKDPSLFESFMNFAAINLNFRGYEQAKAAFEKAIALQPDSYDAHMGLGVALRGLGDYAGAKAEYNRAKEIDPKRTDYIFNLGLLAMDYENQGTPEDYRKAAAIFEDFRKNATKAHKKDPDGKKGKEKSWYAKAGARIKQANKAEKQIEEALKEMEEMKKLEEEMAKREAEAKAMMEKAKELEEKEAAGEAVGGGEQVDWEAEEAPEGAGQEPAPEAGEK